MDYSQFGAMLPELIILGLFLVVFLLDTFTKDGSAKRFLTPVTTVLFGLAAVAIWLIPSCGTEVFGGMYVDSAACKGHEGYSLYRCIHRASPVIRMGGKR